MILIESTPASVITKMSPLPGTETRLWILVLYIFLFIFYSLVQSWSGCSRECLLRLLPRSCLRTILLRWRCIFWGLNTWGWLCRKETHICVYLLIVRWSHYEMLLRYIKNRVDVKSMICKIAFLDLKGCSSLFIQLYLMNNMEISYWVAQKENKIVDFSIMEIDWSGVNGNLKSFFRLNSLIVW